MSATQKSEFSVSLDHLKDLTQYILEKAKTLGATDSAVLVSESISNSVNIRQSEVETIEYNHDKGVSIKVYLDKKCGKASTSDLSKQALDDTVTAAVNIAKYTGEDPYAGLADREELAFDYQDLNLYHPWEGYAIEQGIELARECESAAFAVDSRITKSEGASVSTGSSLFAYANSLGFVGGYPTSYHSISCAMIAESEQGMQRDGWYHAHRMATNLEAPIEIGKKAAERTLRRLNAQKLSTMQVPVLFESRLASGLISHFTHAISGGSLYRRSSFLLDSLGQAVFAPCVQIQDDPFVPYGFGSAAFDNEGVRTRQRLLVEEGVVQGYVLSSYSARKLGMKTTGNAGGTHNLIVQSTGEDLPALLKKMDRGLFVTELLGSGVNLVTGDYSRGACGFWVENGEIQYPVEEITIAGNLREMYKQILAIGTDRALRGSTHVGSILIENMMIAGN